MATILACAAATAVITGALLVGDSMRGSLTDLAVGRLGRVEMAMSSPHFLRSATLAAFRRQLGRQSVAGTILLRGSIAHAETGARVNQAQVAGVDESFWTIATDLTPKNTNALPDRSVVLNESLASDLGAKVGDDVLLRLPRQDGIPLETLMGRRENRLATMRLTVREVIPNSGPGGFSLNSSQHDPRNAFIPLTSLQRALKRPDEVNTVLVSSQSQTDEGTSWLHSLDPFRPSNALRGRAMQMIYRAAFAGSASPYDLGLDLREDLENQAIVVESRSLMLSDVLLRQLRAQAGGTHCTTIPVFSYLANTIALNQPASTQPGQPTSSAPSPVEIPYSTIAAIGLGGPAGHFVLTTGETIDALEDDEILINEWTARQLGIASSEALSTSEPRRRPGPSSPGGAQARSQGRQPLESAPSAHSSPEGATETRTAPRTSAALSGLTNPSATDTRGSRPWLQTSAPTGADSRTPDTPDDDRIIPGPAGADSKTPDTPDSGGIVPAPAGAASQPALETTSPTTVGPSRPGALNVKPTDRITLTYYLIGEFGQLRTETATFRLRGIVKMQGLAASRTLTPVYEGMTDAKRLSDWNPPFPIDLKRIRPADEKYWDDYGPAPKAFISIKTGQTIWGKEYERFGNATSLRIYPPPGTSLTGATAELQKSLQSGDLAEAAGLRFVPVRANALAAAKGSTDFAMLFLSFSFFIMFAAALLIALMFRLGLDRRSGEIGLLMALGFTPATVRKLLLQEGLALASIGTLIGLAAGASYAALMLAGLRTWWSAAVNAPFLKLHVEILSLLIGAVAGMVVAWASVRWSLRGLGRASARSLLAGNVMWGATTMALRQARSRLVVVLIALVAGLVLTVLAALTLPPTIAFFVAGIVMLVACMVGMNVWIRTGRRAVIGPGPLAALRLGIRNATRHRRRSLMTAALIAAAAFNIVAVGASHRTPGEHDQAKTGGTGGFSLMAESTIPILSDLNTPAGRSKLNVTPATQEQMASGQIIPFRVRPGDDASCLNLYGSRSPRILGATSAMIQRGGFSFQACEASPQADKNNPWTLLTAPADDGTIPAIGDANTVTWMLHLGLGATITVQDERGRPVKLRMVGMLSGSVLQGGLIIAEREFVQLWPSIGGYSFFLIDTPLEKSRPLEQALERDLGDYGFDATSTTGKLADYMAVENTYLSTFQTLGGLGPHARHRRSGARSCLRNVWERRRRELALLQAVGFRRGTLADDGPRGKRRFCSSAAC